MLQSILHKRIPLTFLSLPLLLMLLQLAALSVACFILLWFVTLLQAWVAATLLCAASSQHETLGSTFIFTVDTIFQRSSSSKTPSWLTQSETFSTITFNSLFTPSLFRIEFPSEPLCDGLPPWDCVYTAALLRHWWFWLQSGLHPDILVWLVWGGISPYRENSLLEGSHVFWHQTEERLVGFINCGNIPAASSGNLVSIIFACSLSLWLI